jgi:hypothetical protein
VSFPEAARTCFTPGEPLIRGWNRSGPLPVRRLLTGVLMWYGDWAQGDEATRLAGLTGEVGWKYAVDQLFWVVK